jgi:hypothetical protein
MKTRVEMHSPPKDTMKDKFNNDQMMIILVTVIICITVAACIIGGIYVGRGH